MCILFVYAVVDELICPMEPGETVSVIGVPVLDIHNQTVTLEVGD